MRCLTLERAVDERNRLANAILFVHAPLHQLTCVQNGPMIAPAKRVSDFI
ncbi:MAG: hypothetical protein QOH39_949, partial [Verrucomicrobiota bacterium]